MNPVAACILLFIGLCAASAIYALTWAIRTGSFAQLDAASRSIFVADDTTGEDDNFPGEPRAHTDKSVT